MGLKYSEGGSMSEREIAIRAIEAYLTKDKMAHRKPKAEQILDALERLGYVNLPDSAIFDDSQYL